MQITNVRRGAGQAIVACLDIEHDGFHIHDVAIRRNGRGELRLFAPSPNSRRIVTFDHALADQIIGQYQSLQGSLSANDAFRN